jgi:hypothetical protein
MQEIQLYGNLGNRSTCACSEAGFSSQIGDRAWGLSYRGAAFSLPFLDGKRIQCKGYSLKMFPVHGGNCLSRKAVYNWVENVSLMTKRLKRRCRSSWDNWYSDGTNVSVLVEDIPGLNITCFTFYIILWRIYWLTFICTNNIHLDWTKKFTIRIVFALPEIRTSNFSITNLNYYRLSQLDGYAYFVVSYVS